jgi:hypothetical protein
LAAITVVVLLAPAPASAESAFLKKHPECATDPLSERVCYAEDTPISNLPGQSVRQIKCHTKETRCGKLISEWAATAKRGEFDELLQNLKNKRP